MIFENFVLNWMVSPCWYSHHLFALQYNDIVVRNYILITLGSEKKVIPLNPIT